MAKKRKKKTLPKDFAEQLKQRTLDELKAIFEDTELDARGGLGKVTTLSFDECPDELARWLVAQGADVNAEDTYQRTPLEHRMTYRGSIDVLLELGARVQGRAGGRSTPLHTAMDRKVERHVSALLARGADVNARDREGKTPLEYALERCQNADLPRMVAVARLALAHGAEKTDKARSCVQPIGERFEFHRAGFNPESVVEHSAALDALYDLFDVTPVPRRREHDGVSPIVASGATWQEQHGELWNLLVPSKGFAKTVQGEVIRIAGRITYEVHGNGGCNWDRDFRSMAQAFAGYVRSGEALAADALRELDDVIRQLPGDQSIDRLAELGVCWVRQNPVPVALDVPGYRR
jgi:hypothetical protein